MRWQVALALVVVASGCESSSTLLPVDVRTDFLPGDEFGAVSVEAIASDGTRRSARFDELSASFVAGARVAELEVPAGRTVLDVSLLDALDRVVISRPVVIDVDRSRASTIVLARSCAEITCSGPDEACQLGRCVSARCIEEAPGECDAPECSSASECTDGPACARPECTASGGCFYAPDHGACGADELCHSNLGCVATEMPMDAGPPDAGPPDAGFDAAVCSEVPCRLVAPQCGCPTGQGCRTVAGVRGCEPAGTNAAREPCAGPEECAPGTLCILRAGRAMGACTSYCSGPGDCGGDQLCGSIAGVTGTGACSFGCDPIGPSGCPAGLACLSSLTMTVPLDGTTVLVTNCGSDTGLATGAPCTSSGECAPGNVCTPTGCTRLCDLDASACEGTDVCLDFTEPIRLPDGRRLGACASAGG